MSMKSISEPALYADGFSLIVGKDAKALRVADGSALRARARKILRLVFFLLPI